MAEANSRQVKWYDGYLICLAGFALTVWAFYPGMMSPDSIAALTAGRDGSLSDINAPLMSALWGLLDKIVAGPGLMLLLQAGIFWGACAVLWSAARRESFLLGLALVLFGFLPHIFSQTVVIWKDIALGASLLMAVALLYRAKRTGSKIALVLSPIFIFYAYAARLNAFPAVFPLAIWSVLVFGEVFEYKKKALSAVFGGVGYFVVLSASVYAVTYGLTGGRTTHPFQQVYLYDLTAMSIADDLPLYPEYIADVPGFDFETVKARYNERSVADLIFANIPNKGDRPVLMLTDDAQRVRELRSAWIHAITRRPDVYIGHRVNVFAQLIGLKRAVTAPYWEQGFASSPPEFRADGNLGTAAMMKYFGAFRRPFPQTFFFRAVVWLLLCGFFLYAALRRGLKDDWGMVFVLGSSALLFTFAYLPTTPSTEFRYLFWPAIAAAMTVIFGTHLLLKERRLKQTSV